MLATTETTKLRCLSVRRAFAAILLTSLLTSCDLPNSSGPSDTEQQATPDPTVGVYKVLPQTVIIHSELAGRTTAYLVAEVRPQVSGIIVERPFREGGDVEAGQILYQIDPSTYQATYDSALATLARDEAALSKARLRAQRYAKLVEAKAVSQESNDDAVADLRQAQATIAMDKAALEKARIDLAYTQVTAPIGGRIGRSSVTQGALVTANQAAALATVRQLDPIYVDVTHSSAELLRLKRVLGNNEVKPLGALSAQVELILEDGSHYGHKGTLEFSEVTVDESTGSVTLRALFPNPEGELLPGMYVRARVQEGVREGAVLVPQQALKRDYGGNASVMILNEDDQVEVRPVDVMRAIDDRWLLNSGLSAGDRVIVEGLQKVRPGTRAKAVLVNASGVDEPGTAH